MRDDKNERRHCVTVSSGVSTEMPRGLECDFTMISEKFMEIRGQVACDQERSRYQLLVYFPVKLFSIVATRQFRVSTIRWTPKNGSKSLWMRTLSQTTWILLIFNSLWNRHHTISATHRKIKSTGNCFGVCLVFTFSFTGMINDRFVTN